MLLRRAGGSIAAGDHRGALRALQAALGYDASHTSAHQISRLAAQLDPKAAGLLPVRVAFLADHLTGPLPSLLQAQALSSGIAVEPYVPDFDVWRQEIADPASELYAARPDVVVLDLLLERQAPELDRGFASLEPAAIDQAISRTVQLVMGAIDAVQSRFGTRLLVHGFATPRAPVLGLLERLGGHGQGDAIRRLNAELRREAATRKNAYVVAIDDLSASLGTGAFFDRRMYVFAKLPYSGQALTALSLEYAKYLRAFFGRAKKVLVLDADNTLWGGIVGEDGVDGLRIDEESGAAGYLDFQRYVAELGRMGVVLVLNSSNDRDNVLEVFRTRPEMVLRESDFALIVANWNDKADNLVEIARQLELGTESFVYVDDDPHQCARVREAMPEVAVIQMPSGSFDAVEALARFGWFDSLTVTEEDRSRNAMYQSSFARSALEQSAGSVDGFLRSLEARLILEPVSAGNVARAASLTQRTNQFNLTTRRYTEGDLRARIGEPQWLMFTARLVDRLGDFGIIGAVFVRIEGADAYIETFLMSCRALRRNVEDAMLAVAVERALERGARRVIGAYRRTSKNGQTAELYPSHGFAAIASPDPAEQRWERTDTIPAPDGLEIVRKGDDRER